MLLSVYSRTRLRISASVPHTGSVLHTTKVLNQNKTFPGFRDYAMMKVNFWRGELNEIPISVEEVI